MTWLRFGNSNPFKASASRSPRFVGFVLANRVVMRLSRRRRFPTIAIASFAYVVLSKKSSHLGIMQIVLKRISFPLRRN